ncbi:MAG: M48 family metallopeptidase [Lachnospiraceae bacterium]|nr:M48 family metallopeptidase [Lachnospiraceae bacterium]
MFGIHRPVKKEQLVYRGLPFTLFRSHRKTVGIQIRDTGEVVVRAPYFCSLRDVELVLETHSGWITAKRDAIARAREESDRPESHYFDGAVFPFGNGCLYLRLNEDPSAERYTVTLHEEQGRQELTLRGASLPPDTCKMLVARWGRRYAGEVLRARLTDWANRLGVTFNTLNIKETKTRWGSCSALGNINLHWKLILVPTRLSDYILVHELCHRLELNHSNAFWSLVERVLPDYKERRKELRSIEKEILNW